MPSYVSTFGGGTVTPSDNGLRIATLSAADTQLYWPRFNYNQSEVVANILIITPSAGGYSYLMPDARLVGAGTTTMFINVGASAFTVKDSAGNSLCSVPATQAVYVILATNSTAAGTWQCIQFAVGSASVTASALKGDGLIVTGSTLSASWPTTSSSTTPYTISTTTDRAHLMNWTGGAGAWSLPAASGNLEFFFAIKNSGSGSLTITPNGTDTINGAATFSVGVGESFLVVCSSATTWLTIGNRITFTATYIQIDVSGTGTYTVPAASQGYLIYDFVGILTGTRNVQFPASVNQFYAHNGTTGAYNLTIGTTVAASATATVVQNDRVVAYSDGTNVYAIVESSLDVSGFQAFVGTRTDVASGTTAMAVSRRYRATGSCTLTLPVMAAGQFCIVEFGTTGTVTVGRNTQTIDGNSADDTCSTYGYVVVYYCDSAGAIVTKLLELLPS